MRALAGAGLLSSSLTISIDTDGAACCSFVDGGVDILGTVLRTEEFREPVAGILIPLAIAAGVPATHGDCGLANREEAGMLATGGGWGALGGTACIGCLMFGAAC